MQIVGKGIACFLTCEPLHHLFDVVFLVGGTISRFGKIDVKALRALSTVAIGRSKGNDSSDVVLHRMGFWNVKVGSDAIVDEILFVLVKCDPSCSSLMRESVVWYSKCA